MQATDIDLLRELGTITVGAAVFAHAGRLVRLPSIVSYILAGIALGPVLHLVEIGHSVELIAEAGVALLLFLVGIEMSLDKVRDIGRSALLLGLIQIGGTAGGGFVLAVLLGFNWVESLFLAGVMTFSSTAVVIKLLDQKGEMKALHARLIVGLLLVQDLVVVLALTVLAGLGEGGAGFAAAATDLAHAFAGMTLLLVVVLVAARFLLPAALGWAARSPETVLIWALFWCFLIVLLASLLGLSIEMGAFLAGVAVAQQPIHEDLHRRLHPLMNYFIAVFLVAIGAQFDAASALGQLLPAAVFAVFVLLAKPLIVYMALAFMRHDRETAFKCATSSGQTSEFGFILLAMGVTAGMITPAAAAAGSMTGIVTIAVSSYFIINSARLHRLFEGSGVLRLLHTGSRAAADEASAHSGHVIVVGMNTLGRAIVQALAGRGEQVLAIDTDPQKLLGLDAETVIGNVEYGTVVEEIGLRRAKLVVSALQIENVNHLLAYRCRAAGVPCAIHAFDPGVVDDLLDLDVAYLMMPSVDAAISQRGLIEKEGLL